MGRIPVRPGRRGPGLLIVFALTGAAADPRPLTVLAVPYVSQSPELCGGAALAMVLRYWGVTGVQPQDFAGSLEADGTGIPTRALQRLAEERGFQAFAFGAGRAEAVHHLAQGRPLIALLASAPGRHHYVVMLNWEHERVWVHDPAVGPFRTLSEAEWQRRWSATGGWTLLLLPREQAAPQAAPEPPSSSGRDDACAAQVRAGVGLALAGQPDAAKERLLAVAARCPRSSAPFTEMAALEFRREKWLEAADLAAEAVRRNPLDRFAWKTLATSRFLAGQRQQALSAWNQVGEPRLDLVQIEGLARTPTRAVHDYLGEPPATLLTVGRVRRAQRRMETLPAASSSRVGYRPLAGGKARLEIHVAERPALTPPRSLLLHSASRALSEGALGVDLLGLGPSGEAVRLSGQWQPARARAALSASAARPYGLPGIVTVEALWDEQSYRLSGAHSQGTVVRERRQRGSLSLAHWWLADTRTSLTAAVDRWNDRGRALSLSGEVDQRLAGDHLAVRGAMAGWWSPRAAPFYVVSIGASVRRRAGIERPGLRAEAAYTAASARAPFALWSGAGTGAARPGLLRAHPLVRDGVIDGTAFGYQVLTGGVQAETRGRSLGPVRWRAAAFVDAAKVLAPRRASTAVDVGVGLRLSPPGGRSAFRVDVATGWGELRPQLSAGWQADWP